MRMKSHSTMLTCILVYSEIVILISVLLKGLLWCVKITCIFKKILSENCQVLVQYVFHVYFFFFFL